MIAASLAAPAAEVVIAGCALPLGCPVRSADGEEIGRLAAADAQWLVVERGFFARSCLVPLRVVAGFDGTALTLQVDKAAVLGGQWEEPAGPPR